MNSAVLIADSNAARGRRLADACASRGLAPAQADSGAMALEMVLGELPDLVVASADLALIDARRLAEIVRANPRTQHVRFVLYGRDVTGGLAAGLFDEVLAPNTRESDVARRFEELLAHRARIDEVDRETSTEHQVRGKLSQIPLPDLLQVFQMNGRTGELELVRGEAGRRLERGRVLLREGNVIQAHAGPRVEGEKALFRLLAWRDGSFAFAPKPVTATARIFTPTRTLLLEGARQLDEWESMRGSLPPLGARVSLAVAKSELPNAVHPVTQEVLLVLEIYDRVRDVVDHCGYPDYQVLRTLRTLVERGLVELRREPDREDAERGALFDAAQMRRLRDWIEGGRPRGSSPVSAKLLLASPDPDATNDFLRLLSGLPGVEVAETADLHADDVAELGHLAVGEGLGIDLVHLPAAAAFAPAWPVLCHGALGTLLLLSQPLAEAEEALCPLLERLAKLPDARLFRVLLLRKGERVQADQLHEKLSVLDSSSLFLLQIESGRDPISLLKTMLARVLP